MNEDKEQIKELKSRLRLIEEFYEENNFIKRIKFYIKYIKEKWKNANNTNTRNNDTSTNDTICDDVTSNTWNNEINNLFNNKKIEKEN